MVFRSFEGLICLETASNPDVIVETANILVIEALTASNGKRLSIIRSDVPLSCSDVVEQKSSETSVKFVGGQRLLLLKNEFFAHTLFSILSPQSTEAPFLQRGFIFCVSVHLVSLLVSSIRPPIGRDFAMGQ